MIISIAGQRNAQLQQIIDGIIAQHRRAARKVMLLDMPAGTEVSATRGAGISSQVEDLLTRYDDIFINITGCAADVCRPALISAQLAIVLLHVEEARLDKEYALIAQLNAARIFNPGLHVLFAVIAGDCDPTPTEITAVRSYCAEVMSARLCGVMIDPGPNLAIGLDALCRKVFEQHPVRSGCALH